MPLAHAVGSTDVPLLEMTIGANLEAARDRWPDRDALIVRHQDVRQTYAEFDRSVDDLARALLAYGIQVGDRVGMWSPNCAEWVHIQYATAKIGAILVNVNPAYRTSELRYALTQSGLRLLVSAPSYLTSDYVSMVDEVRPDVPTLEDAVFLGTEGWEALLGRRDEVTGDDLRRRSATLEPGDPINIQYTSGTTGYPKGATLSHRNILNNGFFTGRAQGFTEEDRVCIPVPFYHCFGMVLGNLACTSHGAAMVIPCPTFDADAVLEAVAEERCTSLYGVPTMFIAELASPIREGLDLSSLRTGIMAGSPCPIEVMKRVRSEMNMRDVTIAYGMTETSPVSTQTTAEDSVERRVSTVGRVHPHVEIKITDPETGATVERGVAGELCTRGYSVMLGYWNDEERTAQSIDGDGFMHSGDLATMDDEGYVNIVGRIKDMIIRGGENIYPREIEEFLYGHPDIEDVQVVGVPDPKFGEEIAACVKCRSGALTDEALKDFCRGRIAHFKVPRYVVFVDEFPMTVTGKIQKFRLRDVAVERLGLGSVEPETA